MTLKLIQLVLLTLLIVSSEAWSVDDLVSNAKHFWPKNSDFREVNNQQKLPAISFELPEENEDFLKEGLALIDTPRNALDLCTHRVISTLKNNCNQLSLEDVGKLAVMLLNCQLEIEGRPTFPCKLEMPLQDCTIAMDANMYSIYNYMSHRAAGICSAIKSDQFRAMTELAVNRLLKTTQSQVDAMSQLNEMEAKSFKEFQENNEKIKDSQKESLNKLKLAENLIEDNLLSLQQELELRQKSESKLIDIQKSAIEISSKLEQIDAELGAEHGRLLKNVGEISTNLQKNNLELLQQFNETLEFLKSFKPIVKVSSEIARTLKSCLEKFVDLFHEIGLELSAELTTFLILNLTYFTCGMIFMLFVGAQRISRCILVLLFLFNNIAAYSKADVDFLPLNTLIWITFFAMKIVGVLKRKAEQTEFTIPKIFKMKSTANDKEDKVDHSSITPLKRTFESLKRAVTPAKETSVKRENGAAIKRVPSYNGSSRDVDDDEINELLQSSSTVLTNQRPMTPAMRRVLKESDSNRTGTPFLIGMEGRVRCQALTAKQVQCKNAAVPGMTTCRIHK